MQLEQILLLVTAVVLTLVALGAGYFVGAEIIRIIRDVTSPSPDSDNGQDQGWAGSLRRIIPFRDRKTVQRIIDHLEDEEPSP